jgi:anti-sigma B factor antagonist
MVPMIGSVSKGVGVMLETPYATRVQLDGAAVVGLVGEIDLAWAETLREELHVALSTMSTRTVVDLSQATFLDSSAMGAIVSAGMRARDAGGWVRLVGPPDNVRRVLELTQIDTVLGLYDSVAEAIAHEPTEIQPTPA